jgi:hypothetical protein
VIFGKDTGKSAHLHPHGKVLALGNFFTMEVHKTHWTIDVASRVPRPPPNAPAQSGATQSLPRITFHVSNCSFWSMLNG